MSARHYTCLDGMRGIAALSVVSLHAGHIWNLPTSDNAYLAVDFFVLLSGFVIGHAYEAKLQAEMSLMEFARKRVARLYPVIFAGMTLGLLVALWTGARISLIAVPLQFLLIPVLWAKVIYPLNAPFWSIFYEVAANFGHALILRRLHTKWLAVVTVGAGLLLAVLLALKPAAGASAWQADAGPGMVGSAIRIGFNYCAGLLIYRLVKLRGLTLNIGPWWVSPFALALILNLPPLITPAAFDAVMIFAVFPVLLLGGMNSLPAGVNAVAEWLGKLSYPLYGTHMPLLLLMGATLSVSAPVAWTTSLILAIAIGAAVQRAWERPLLMRERTTALA